MGRRLARGLRKAVGAPRRAADRVQIQLATWPPFVLRPATEEWCFSEYHEAVVRAVCPRQTASPLVMFNHLSLIALYAR